MRKSCEVLETRARRLKVLMAWRSSGMFEDALKSEARPHHIIPTHQQQWAFTRVHRTGGNEGESLVSLPWKRASHAAQKPGWICFGC